MKILMIDDDSELRNSLESSFKGHDVTLLSDPLVALENYKDNQEYHIVITDYYMPNLKGDQLILQILKICPTQHFIIYSGAFPFELTSLIEKHEELIQIIRKPYELQDFDVAIRIIDKHIKSAL